MRRTTLLAAFLLACASWPRAAICEVMPKPGKAIIPPSEEWIAKVRDLAPAAPTVVPKRKREVLLFYLFTGFDHKVIPHADEAVKAIAEKSGAFGVTLSTDIEMFQPENIRRFDAVILNNCCSVGPARDLFLDVLSGNIKDAANAHLGDRYKGLGDGERKARAAALEKSLVDHIAGGAGLVAVHGGIVMQNNSARFGDMLGGSFDYHPKAQEFTLYPVDSNHPLLMIKSADIQGKREGKPVDDILYVSWIKKFGKGRVFFVSPGHFPESYQSKAMLRFYLDGIQYALGDLECDDAPLTCARP